MNGIEIGSRVLSWRRKNYISVVCAIFPLTFHRLCVAQFAFAIFTCENSIKWHCSIKMAMEIPKNMLISFPRIHFPFAYPLCFRWCVIWAKMLASSSTNCAVMPYLIEKHSSFFFIILKYTLAQSFFVYAFIYVGMHQFRYLNNCIRKS